MFVRAPSSSLFVFFPTFRTLFDVLKLLYMSIFPDLETRVFRRSTSWNSAEASGEVPSSLQALYELVLGPFLWTWISQLSLPRGQHDIAFEYNIVFGWFEEFESKQLTSIWKEECNETINHSTSQHDLMTYVKRLTYNIISLHVYTITMSTTSNVYCLFHFVISIRP